MRWRLGPPLLWRPGHWLLMIGAAVTLLQLPMYLLWAIVEGKLILLPHGGSQIAIAILYTVAAKRNRERRWRVLFALLSLIWMLQGLYYWGFWFDFYFYLTSLWTLLRWGHLLLGVWLTVVAILDFKAGQRRDWLHWTGVATFLAGVGMTLFWMIANMVMRQ